MIFRSEDIKYFEEPGRDLVCYTTIDLASDPEESKGKDIDYNVVLTAGKDLITGQIYVLDYFRERCNPSRVIDAIFKQVRSWNPVKVGLESIAYQKSMKYWIRERMKSEDVHFHVESITHGKQSKYRRIQNLQPIFCAGKISIRNYMTSLENELLCFPYGAHDDLIDCLSMQLPMWKKTISLDERPVEVEPDPRSFESIEKELYMRAEKTDFFTQDALFPGDLNYAFR
jgi:predicted phage terminase large subunit-like protein